MNNPVTRRQGINNFVIPAKAGIQKENELDSSFHGKLRDSASSAE
jgi:hypothetical protein